MGSSSPSVRSAVTVVFLSVFISVAWASGPAAAAENRSPVPGKQQTGSISGTVTDESLIPLPSQYVRVYGPGEQYVSGGYDYTDSSGDYTIDGLEDGTYFLRAASSNSDWVVELYGGVPCPNNHCSTDDGVPVVVSGGAAVANIDFQLAEAGSIKGSVFLPSGNDVYEADIRVYDPTRTYDGGRVCDYANFSYDGDYHVYEARGLPEGCYFVTAEPDYDYPDRNYAPTAYPDVAVVWRNDAPLVGDPVAVVAGEQTTGVDIDFQPGSVIAVQVTDGTSRAPISNSWLDVWGKTVSGEWKSMWVGGDFKRDSSGIFLAEGLGAGEYAVIAGAWPWEEGPFKGARQVADNADLVAEIWDDIPCPTHACGPEDGTVVAVEESSLNVLEIELAEGGSISGTVTDEDKRALLDDIRIQITAPGLSTWSGGYEFGDTWAWEGEYTVHGLPAGSYSVRAVGRYQYDGGEGGPAKDPNDPGYETELYPGVTCEGQYCDTALGTPVPVTAGVETENIDFALALEGVITGEVWPNSKNVPLSGVTVRAWASGGEDAGVWDRTDSNGVYELPGLGAGSYFVTADTRGSRHDERIGGLYDDFPCTAGNCDPTAGDAVGVSVDMETTDIDFFLTDGGVIEGTVTDGGGPGVAGVLVTVTDGSGTVFGTAVTPCDGAYSIGGLTTGTYYAFTTNYRGHEDQAFYAMPCAGPCMPGAGGPIAVTAGSTTAGVDFPLNVLFADGFESGDTTAW